MRADFTEPAFLVANNVPWDVAHSLEPDVRLAYVIYYGQLKGGVWNWDAMDWEPPKSS